jgi:chorismate mutase
MSTEGGARVAALRGATTVASDTPEDIVEATLELLQELLDRNGVTPEDLISIVFTSTQDLTAEFPAVAARKLGLVDIPLLCAAEIAVPGALARCVRVLLHLNFAGDPATLRHAYLRGASELRTDLPGSI